MHEHICMCMYVCMNTYVSVFLCMYVWVCMCMYEYICAIPRFPGFSTPSTIKYKGLSMSLGEDRWLKETLSCASMSASTLWRWLWTTASNPSGLPFLWLIFLRVCMYISMHEYVWVCMSMYECMYEYVWEYVWVCMSMYEYVRVWMSMYEHVWVCMSIYEYVWVCISMYKYVWVYW